MRLQNTYAATGHLDAIVDSANTAHVHWQALQRDTSGRITKERLGCNNANFSAEPGTLVQRRITTTSLLRSRWSGAR